jgi:TPR repeat protein
VEKDEARAARLFGQAADQGVAEAQHSLGLCYDVGSGVEKDEAKAVRLYGQAAEQGRSHAQYCLGLCYSLGKGLQEDDAKAARLFWQAAEQGLADAQDHLGRCYTLGMGVDPDMVQAAQLFRQAAEQDKPFARLWLGWCCEHGQGTQQDAHAAGEQYRLAVQGGYALANASLGLCFEKGTGMPSSDPAEAARLYALAAEDGISSNMAFDYAMSMLPENRLAPDVPSVAALAHIRHAVYWLNLAARLVHVAAAQQLEALTGRRDVVSACCVGCGAVRKLKTCSKCSVARFCGFCDTECSARMWPAHIIRG